MTGWGMDENKTLKVGEKASPSAATLQEIAAAGQRVQLESLLEAVRAHPDLAVQLAVALKLVA